jgi:hypothetical protein
MFLAKDHAAFDIDLVKFAGWEDIGQTSCADSLKGGNAENCDSMGNPAEKWFAYSTLRSRVHGGIFQQPWPHVQERNIFVFCSPVRANPVTRMLD